MLRLFKKNKWKDLPEWQALSDEDKAWAKGMNEKNWEEYWSQTFPILSLPIPYGRILFLQKVRELETQEAAFEKQKKGSTTMSWFKPKGWKELSPEDKVWAKSIDSENWHAVMLDCLESGGALGRITYLFHAHCRHGSRQHYALVCTAIDKQRTDALKVFLNARFTFESTMTKDKELVEKLFRLSLIKTPDVWETLYEYNQKTLQGSHCAITDAAIIRETKAEGAPAAILKAHAAKLRPEDTDIYKSMLESSRLEILEELLSCARKFIRSQTLLDTLLKDSISGGAIEKARILINAGADATLLNGTLAGKTIMQEPTTVVVAAQPPQEDDFILSGKDTIYRVQNLAGLTLTTTFNFTTQQQIQVVEKGGKLAMTSTGFHEIDRNVVGAMQQKLLDLGGDAQLVELSIKLKPKN